MTPDFDATELFPHLAHFAPESGESDQVRTILLPADLGPDEQIIAALTEAIELGIHVVVAAETDEALERTTFLIGLICQRTIPASNTRH